MSEKFASSVDFFRLVFLAVLHPFCMVDMRSVEKTHLGAMGDSSLRCRHLNKSAMNEGARYQNGTSSESIALEGPCGHVLHAPKCGGYRALTGRLGVMKWPSRLHIADYNHTTKSYM